MLGTWPVSSDTLNPAGRLILVVKTGWKNFTSSNIRNVKAYLPGIPCDAVAPVDNLYTNEREAVALVAIELNLGVTETVVVPLGDVTVSLLESSWPIRSRPVIEDAPLGRTNVRAAT